VRAIATPERKNCRPGALETHHGRNQSVPEAHAGRHGTALSDPL